MHAFQQTGFNPEQDAAIHIAAGGNDDPSAHPVAKHGGETDAHVQAAAKKVSCCSCGVAINSAPAGVYRETRWTVRNRAVVQPYSVEYGGANRSPLPAFASESKSQYFFLFFLQVIEYSGVGTH